MGVGFLILLVALVPLVSSRDLRTATKVNRRTAPDPLLVKLFNDPTVTSLTKQTTDDSDETSASGSWAMSGDAPKMSDSDKSTDTKQNAQPSSDTATAVELATDQSTANAGSGEEPSAQTAAPTKTEDETVETKDDSITNEDENAKKSSFIPAETQTVTDQVEEGGNDVRDSTAAPKGKAFDEKNMYDATIVKKDDVPKPNDVKATAKSVVLPSPDEQGGLAPLTSDITAPQNDQPQVDQTQQLDQAQQVQQPQQDMAQMAMQPQQDMPQPALQQPAMQQPQQDIAQMAMQPQQDMPQAPQQPAASPASLTQDPSLQAQAQAYTGQYQDPSQQQQGAGAFQDQMIPQATDQAMMQGQGNAPVAPVNPYTDPSLIGQQVDPQTGMPIAGMQAVPVFQGLKAKKVTLKEDECDDMYDSCPEFAKNEYCEKYVELMKTQCRKSCGFCKVNDEASGESSGSLLADSSASGSAMWNDEDNELPIWRKSGIPSVGDKVEGESASGSAITSDVWSSSASGANMIKGETDNFSDSAPVVPAPKKEEAAEVWESSGSGQPSEDIGSASGANLAEDLATGTVSKTEQVKEAKPEVTAPKTKYSEIPVPRVIIQQQPAAEIYPRIDLKVIAKAVNAYKSTALRMLGEAIRDAAQEAEDKAVKRTNIPMPPANEILEKMGFPMEEPKSEIPPFPQPAPNNPYAQYYQQPGYYNNGQYYYGVQQNGVAKSEVEQPQPKVTEAPKVEDKSEDETSAEGSEEEKKSDIKDPFQYVRHMKAGQSMQPIESRPGASLAPHSHSNPIILFKNSQISNEAAKKNAIPKPAPKITAPQIPQALPSARFGIPQPRFNRPIFAQPKSQLPLNNNFNQEASLDQPVQEPAQETAPQFEQEMPTSDNQLDSTMDDAAMMRSETTKEDQTYNQQPGDDDANLRELRSFFPDKENKKKGKRNVKPKTH